MPKISFKLKAGLNILRQLNSLRSARARKMKSFALDAVVDHIRVYIYVYSLTHHKSAQRLGAKPTGHLVKAANSVKREPKGFSVTSAGFRRAFHDLHIRAKNAPNLTIPINRISYGKWFHELPEAIKEKAFRPKGHDIIAYTENRKLVPLYALKKSVIVPREKNLLPPTKEIAEVYNKAFKEAFSNIAR